MSYPKLTVDVFKRSKCPKWAKWAAVDMDGDGFFYSHKPVCGHIFWYQSDGKSSYIRRYSSSGWRNSLIERPAAESEHPKLTVDIFNRPDCPEWAKWAAVNGGGKTYVYSIKPVLSTNAWSLNARGGYAGDYDSSDWKNSLIERPAAKSENALADKSTPAHDDVSAPAYYVNTPFGLEVRKITEHYDPYLAAALKYIFRNGQKVYDGLTAKESAIKDLRKAIQNIKFEIEKIENS